MPHIVFENRIDLNEFSKNFSPIFQRDSTLIKIQTIFVDKDNFTALLPTIVIDESHQEFLIELSTRKEKTTMRGIVVLVMEVSSVVFNELIFQAKTLPR